MSSLHDQIEFWAAYAGRPLNKFEQLVIARPFKYSSYWQTWNRVIKPVWAGLPQGMVEIALSPINGFERGGEKAMLEIAAMKIRSHLTTPDQGDIFASSIPDEVRDTLVKGIGAEKTQFLLYGNIWDCIDWVQYRKVDSWSKGGGVPLDQCHRQVVADARNGFANSF